MSLGMTGSHTLLTHSSEMCLASWKLLPTESSHLQGRLSLEKLLLQCYLLETRRWWNGVYVSRSNENKWMFFIINIYTIIHKYFYSVNCLRVHIWTYRHICMYLNTFVYIVLYVIHNITLLKIQNSKLGESWKRRGALCCWQTHGMEKLSPLENKSNINLCSTTDRVGMHCFVKMSAHICLLNSYPWEGGLTQSWVLRHVTCLAMKPRMWGVSDKFLSTIEWCGCLGWEALQLHWHGFDSTSDIPAFCYSQFFVTWS